MSKGAAFLHRYRATLLAVMVSAALHAAMFVSLPQQLSPEGETTGPAYTATLDPAAPTVVDAPAATPRPARVRSPHPRSRIAPVSRPVAEIPDAIAALEPTRLEPLAAAPEVLPAPDPMPPPEPVPEKIALAQPVAPLAAPQPDPFPGQQFPASVSIDYQLTSAFADGRASYRWEREGDTYRISAEAAAEGFFTLFLEGRIVQESRGTVTSKGLRPLAFSERKPGGPVEGLEFDWPAGQVTFDRNGERKTSALADNTVDWLSMIFQLAHVPPKGESFDLQVFTQRRMYRFHLKVLGVEEIEIPLGRVRALHLNHTDAANPKEVVDVWLGVDQHYLPVKLRFPAARNRLVVEQVATRLTMSEAPPR